MHERERHRIILSAVQERPILTVQDIVELTGASEATIRRDVAALALQNRVKKVLALIEPLAILLIGSIIGVIILGIILAITSVNEMAV